MPTRLKIMIVRSRFNMASGKFVVIKNLWEIYTNQVLTEMKA